MSHFQSKKGVKRIFKKNKDLEIIKHFSIQL